MVSSVSTQTSSAGSMMIDHESARNLELVENATKKKFHSLFG